MWIGKPQQRFVFFSDSPSSWRFYICEVIAIGFKTYHDDSSEVKVQDVCLFYSFFGLQGGVAGKLPCVHTVHITRFKDFSNVFLIALHKPLSCLANVFDPGLLELLNKVLLELFTSDRDLLAAQSWRVNQRFWLDGFTAFDFVLGSVFIADEQLLPALFVVKIPVHQHGEVILLLILVNVVRAHYRIHMLHRADGVIHTDIQVVSRLEWQGAEPICRLLMCVEEAVASDWGPQFKVTIFRVLLVSEPAHHIDIKTFRHGVPINQVGFVQSRVLFVIYVLEKVGKEYSVLFAISTAEVQELLTVAIHVRQVVEKLHVVEEGNHGDKTSAPFNRKLVIRTSLIEYVQWWLEGFQKPRQQD